MSHSQKCNPHYCPFDSPACPERCNSSCKRIKPNCVSVTAQEAMNIPELEVPRSKTGIPIKGISTRERVFGIPYDPKKDFDVLVPDEDLEQYIKQNYESMHDKALKAYLGDTCCKSECKCVMGPCCMCYRNHKKCNPQKKESK